MTARTGRTAADVRRRRACARGGGHRWEPRADYPGNPGGWRYRCAGCGASSRNDLAGLPAEAVTIRTTILIGPGAGTSFSWSPTLDGPGA